MAQWTYHESKEYRAWKYTRYLQFLKDADEREKNSFNKLEVILSPCPKEAKKRCNWREWLQIQESEYWDKVAPNRADAEVRAPTPEEQRRLDEDYEYVKSHPEPDREKSPVAWMMWKQRRAEIMGNEEEAEFYRNQVYNEGAAACWGLVVAMGCMAHAQPIGPAPSPPGSPPPRERYEPNPPNGPGYYRPNPKPVEPVPVKPPPSAPPRVLPPSQPAPTQPAPPQQRPITPGTGSDPVILPGPKSPVPGPPGLLSQNPSKLVAARVCELQNAIPPAQKGRITMSVAVVEDSNGHRFVLVSSSEGDYIRKPVRPVIDGWGNATVVPGTGHAEVNIIDYAKKNNLRVIDIGATRPVCIPCQDDINPTGANISTPVRPRQPTDN